MKTRFDRLLLLLLWLSLPAIQPASAQTDIVNTKHNLSVSGPGPIRALTETRICLFCHTPHNAAPNSPLWNKELNGEVYTVYTSPTLKAGPLGQPSGPTKLCLSCHDGTIALGEVLNPPEVIDIPGGGRLPPGSLSDFGIDLSGHHPVSFSYERALPNDELVPNPPEDLVFGGADELHCTTCHDPHNDTYGKFLAKDNHYSALCITCHQMTGWGGSKHATSTVSVAGILPRAPKTYPTWTHMDEWGCETCHTPHFAPTPELLLNFTPAPPAFSCISGGCHSSEPPPPHATATSMADIAGQVRKPSAHSDLFGGALGGVACSSCHNPHQVYDRPAEAPYLSGMIQGVSGVDKNGMQIPVATFEYELCFKCHSDNNSDSPFVPRVVATNNKRFAFDPGNDSFHPVVSSGRNVNIPSIPSELQTSMTSTQMIYCSSCHADDNNVSKGPHGSDFAPILKLRYDTMDNTPENFEAYALCYDCHNRTSILGDASFRKKTIPTTPSGGGHSGHLANGVPCSACHDPHGISGTIAANQPDSGSHTHLINFDTRIVSPMPGKTYPIFDDEGEFSGKCTLVCHGVAHDEWSYP